jgi:hypothetical protein
MEYVKLNSGWLQKQIMATQREVKEWPERFREQAAESTKSGGADSADQCIQSTPQEGPRED